MLNTGELFNLSNLFVLPFWTLMIILPNWGLTKKIMGSYFFLPFLPLIALYIYFISGSLTAESLQTLSNPQLDDIARFFSDEKAAATGWTHFLVMDLFVGRWIYWQGQETGIWTIHSLLLSLVAGPVGLLSHLVTKVIREKFLSVSVVDTVNTVN